MSPNPRQGQAGNQELRALLRDQASRTGRADRYLGPIWERNAAGGNEEQNEGRAQDELSTDDSDSDDSNYSDYDRRRNRGYRKPAYSSEKKQRKYHGMIRLITGLLAGIQAIVDPSTPDQERRYVEDFEAAASYTDTTEGFVTHKVFHNLFKRGLGAGSARLKHDEIMRRPHIRLHWNNAEAQERAYLADTYNDTARGEPLQPGNFATSFWPAYRAEFLGLGQNPWHVAHLARFSRKGFEQGKDTVSEYFERRFMQQAQTERSAEGWPTQDQAWDLLMRNYQAHVFFANLDMNIKAKLLQDHSTVCDPAKMPSWSLTARCPHNRTVRAVSIGEAPARRPGQTSQGTGRICSHHGRCRSGANH